MSMTKAVTTGVAILACSLCMSILAPAAAFAQEVPEQFKVWGKQAGENKYLADAGVDTPGEAAAPATDAEKAAGFFVFTKPVSAAITPDYVPTADDRCTSLTAADCRDQYGPVTFFVYALKKGDFGVRVSDLKGPGSSVIPAANIDIRAVRYVNAMVGNGAKKTAATPLLLESLGTKTIQANRFGQFWLTYYVPKNAAPGKYAGQATITLDGKEVSKLPLTIEVYPFELLSPDVRFTMNYQRAAHREAAVAAKQLADFRCHGMTTGEINPPVNDKGDVDEPVFGRSLDVYKKAGLGPWVVVHYYNRITSEWKGNWFTFYPFSEEIDKRFIAGVKAMEKIAKDRGLKLIVEPVDEPGSHPTTSDAGAHYAELMRKETPSVLVEFCCGGGWAMGRDEANLWKGKINIWMTNRWYAEKLAQVVKDDPNAIIQAYNMAGGGSQAGGTQSARTAYGFFLWKSEARGQDQWAYDTQDEFAFAWNAADKDQGPVPVLRWEAVREGVKDYKYAYTLQQMVKKNPKSPAAADAAKALDRIRDAIGMKALDYDPIGGGRVVAPPAGTCEQWRAEIAKYLTQMSAK